MRPSACSGFVLRDACRRSSSEFDSKAPMKSGAFASLVMPGLTRASTPLLNQARKDVDGRDKPGHDESDHFQAVRKYPKTLAAFSVILSGRGDKAVHDAIRLIATDFSWEAVRTGTALQTSTLMLLPRHFRHR